MNSTQITRRCAAALTADTAMPVVFATASGCHIEDIEGNRYIDFITGYGVVSTGWQRPEMLRAIKAQLDSATFAPPWMPTREAMHLAEALLAVAPAPLKSCARAISGADANEVAVKAHFAQRGGKLLVIGRAYHGGTTRSLALSDGEAFRLPPSPASAPPRVPPAYCYRCPYGKTYPGCSLECAEAVERAVRQDASITGILLEPVIGSGGAIVPPQAYFDAIADICRRLGLTLILDEVMTGCGRLGTFFAADAFGLHPNAVTLAKSLGGGYVPIGAALLDGELSESLKRHEDVSSTMAWTPLACAAALVNLQLIQEENLPARAAETGVKLLGRLREVFERHLPDHCGDVRGKGMLIGVEMVKNLKTKEPAPNLTKRIVLRCYRGGLLLGTSWDWHSLLIMPPLTLDDHTMGEAMEILETALRACSRKLDSR